MARTGRAGPASAATITAAQVVRLLRSRAGVAGHQGAAPMIRLLIVAAFVVILIAAVT